MRPPGAPLEPFAQDPELARLLAAERDAPDPDRAVRDRMWARLGGTLVAPPVPRSLGAAKALLATAAVGVVVAVGVWGSGPRRVGTPVAPVASASAPASGLAAVRTDAPHLEQPSIDAPRATPAPAAPLVERDEPVRRARPRLGDTLGAEQRLIEEAREALAHGRPRAAASVLEEHARRFGRGQLAEERDSLAIRTEIVLGRPGEAIEQADAFLRRYPDSVFAPVVRSLAARARAATSDDPL
jgi:hypothetical protein